MAAPPSHIVLLNARARMGTAGDSEPVVRARFDAHHVRADIRLLTKGDDVAATARRAVEDGPQVIVAGGGDGTLNAVAGAVSGTALRFGILLWGH